MAGRVKCYMPVLKELQKSRKNKRKAIIEGCDNELIYCLCECVMNVLNGNIPTTKQQKQKLQRYAKTLKKVESRKVSLKKKKELFIQEGGFLPLLLAPIIGVVGGLIGDLVSSAIKK